MKVAFFYSDFTANCAEYLPMLAENGIECAQFKNVRDADTVVEASRGADAIINGAVPFPAEVIARLDDSVKAIVRMGMGYDDIDVEAASKRGIYVCNTPDYAMEEVAVHQVALILAVLRKVCFYDKRLREGCWNKVGYLEGYPARRISTLSLGLLGFGRIAKNVAKYIKSFGATVYAYDPFLPESVFEEHGVIQAKTPEEIYAVADIITPNVPLMDSSYHLISRESIGKMKDGVIIVNTGRGALIDEAALIEGLQSGKVRAAGLDVFEKEPFYDRSNPLMSMENVVLTPHIAYQTEESYQELQRKTVELAIVGAKGGMPYSTVNKKARE